jgi:hypothetical protein
MFALNGQYSVAAIAAQIVIDNCGLNLQAEHDDSFAITAYRVDPFDRYSYITAFAGLRQREPMFGPLRRQSDFRLIPEGASISDPYGFRKRESVLWTHSIQRESWHLYISGRSLATREVTDGPQVASLVRAMQTILPLGSSSTPLFPELWFQERLTRDELRDTIHDCVPGTSLEEVAAKITINLGHAFGRFLDTSEISLALYLDTGDEWRLCGSTPTHPGVRERVPKEERNAFTWVANSKRPILADKNLSGDWRSRVEACGGSFMALVDDEALGGLCLVPILYGPDRRESLGVIEMLSRKRPLLPAHVFLLSRLSVAVSGYLSSRMPLPGFPWWPDAKLSVGHAQVEIGNRAMQSSSGVPESLMQVAQNIASDLLPKGSHVTLSPLRWGQSGAQVFRLDVHDEGNVVEVPRVLKIASQRLIRQELRAYFRYAHNKLLGSDARIDVARSSVWPVTMDQKKWFDGSPPEAIVYTLVGADEDALPWSSWAHTATIDELKRGLELLWDRLQTWYTRTRQAEAAQNIVELMIEPIAKGKLKSYLKRGMKTTPTLADVQSEIDRLCQFRPRTPAKTCIVHGDLHADNLFAIFSIGKSKPIKRVALIDWASVRSGWHLLSDVSKLMVDLAYRIRPCEETRILSEEMVKQWGMRLACEPDDFMVALAHQIAKIMFYQADASGEPYITHEARLGAWQDLKRLCRLLKAKR